MTIHEPSTGTLTMRGTTPLAALAFAAALAAGHAPAAAQSDILLQARSGSPAGDRFRVDSAGGTVALGKLGTGVIPASGTGERMMWHPFRAAFRAGAAVGTGWDDGSTGFYSWAGGSGTVASANYSFAMGNAAVATGTASVALGDNVLANGNYAVALGQRASAGTFSGTFTWADASTASFFSNDAANSFQIRAAGGVKLFTNSAASTGMSLSAGGSSWNVLSDRTRKRDFTPVDGEDVLARIRDLPVTTWAYIDEVASVRHIGPMAQDWHAAFGFSQDETTINMSDLDGVNLAAVQALERRTADLRAQLAERDARIRALEARMARMEALLAARP
ncbi:MAG TPA: tail fiber domain-containing protein [Longimicrobium sp.]|nr:tail fiber domain-containing protein [Longimicrobium sp.]